MAVGVMDEMAAPLRLDTVETAQMAADTVRTWHLASLTQKTVGLSVNDRSQRCRTRVLNV